ncbi:MAG TPA: hypothetical protein VFS05_07705 [Gemmatimonadaceae bacterium]|nr:hypothetical protein [Gemmatimonadaceae bacterium]
MRRTPLAALLIALALAPTAAALRAQDPPADSARGKKPGKEKKEKTEDGARAAGEARVPGVFASDSVLPLTITANLKALARDRGEKRPWHGATLARAAAGGRAVTLPARLRTRGIYRLKMCSYPPLRLDIAKGAPKDSLFDGTGEPKIVAQCADGEKWERYLLEEYLIYRTYQLFTPLSFRARLARITWADSAGGSPKTRWAIIVEDPERLARRNGGRVLEVKGAKSDDLDPYQSALFAVFQYFAGNTDWSISALHNVELVQQPGIIHPVAYDFDWSGVISTTYATPDPRLKTRSVSERVYRGWCANNAELPKVLALFNEKKDAIYALYRSASWLDPKEVKRSLDYYDDFYETINDRARMEREIVKACRVE